MDWKSTAWIVGLAVRLGWGPGRMSKESWNRQTNTPRRKDVLSHTEYILIRVHRSKCSLGTSTSSAGGPSVVSSFLLFYEVRGGIVTSVLRHFVENLPFYITNQMWFWNFLNFYFILECNLQCCVSFKCAIQSQAWLEQLSTHAPYTSHFEK